MSPQVASVAAHHMREAAVCLQLSEEFRRFGARHRPKYLQVIYRYAAMKMSRAAREHLTSLRQCLAETSDEESALEQVHGLTKQLHSSY